MTKITCRMKSLLGLLSFVFLLQLPSIVSSHKLETIKLTSLGGNLTLSCFMHPEQVQSVLHWITPSMDIFEAGVSSDTFTVHSASS